VAETVSISKAKPAEKSMDYAALREEGIKLLQEMAGDKWTDFNAHDPGITILEVLCYAITDLGYRTNYDVKDILASHPLGSSQIAASSFKASELLSCNPITIKDFRKIILDCERIQNAHLQVSNRSDQLFYFVEAEVLKDSIITYQGGEGAKRVELQGLYEVMLEFSDEDLNSNTFAISVQTGDVGIGTNSPGLKDGMMIKGSAALPSGKVPFEVKNINEIEVAFPLWDVVSSTWRDTIDIAQINVTKVVDYRASDYNDYYVMMNIKDSSNKVVVTDFGVQVKVTSNVDGKDKLKPAIKRMLENVNLSLGDGGKLYQVYNERIKKAWKYVNTVQSTLNRNRNIGEDFYKFKAIWPQEIGINADIDIASDATASEVLAEIIYNVRKFFTPPIPFQSLSDMLAKGKSSDEIFNGPLLQNGFIDEEDIEDLKRKDIIYTSDIIHIIMNIEGVNAVRNLNISNYIDNRAIQSEVLNCLKLPSSGTFKPKLSSQRSDFKFRKKGGQLEAIKTSQVKVLLQKRQEKEADEVSVENNDLKMPLGENLDIKQYHSIHNHLPKVYGIGEEGLPDTANDQRKAQARQLKAYLLFFDQIMANHLSQLAHIKDIFAANPTHRKTRFAQAVDGVTKISELYNNEFTDEKGEIIVIKDKDGTLKTSEFVEILEVGEQEEKERRNRMLKHLLARHGEDFGVYENLMKSIDRSNAGADVINTAETFLVNYPSASAQRGKAFNHLAKNDIWNTENVPGIQKRLCLMLGMADSTRRNLWQYVQLDLKKNNNGFTIRDRDEILLISTGLDDLEWEETLRNVLEYGKSKTNYLKIFDGSKYYFNLRDGKTKIISRTTEYETEAETDAALESIIQTIESKVSSEEGMHLIEHVHLRPKNNGDPFLDYMEGVADPYSFRLSIYLPVDSARFQKENFKRHAEQLILKEFPAHVIVDIYWLGFWELNQFEDVYKTWLETYADDIKSEKQKKDALKAMLEMMAQIHAAA